MTLYDVQVVSANGRTGDTIRVDAVDPEAASSAALALVPEGWTASRVSDASDHGEAWGFDTTAPDFPGGPLITEGGVADPPGEPIEPEGWVDEPTA